MQIELSARQRRCEGHDTSSVQADSCVLTTSRAYSQSRARSCVDLEPKQFCTLFVLVGWRVRLVRQLGYVLGATRFLYKRW